MSSSSTSRPSSTAETGGVMKPEHYFVCADEASTQFLGKPTWCPLSERRLLNKLCVYKPVGPKRNFNLFGLTYAMHYIVEDEEDVDFEEYLLPDDYQIYVERQKSPQTNIMVFPPKYRFRPSKNEIMEKIKEFYDLDVLNQYDPIIEETEGANNEYGIPASILMHGRHR